MRGLFIVASLFFSSLTFANPLGMIFSRQDARGRIEINYQADTNQLDDKKKSRENRLVNYDGNLNINFYKGEKTIWFFSAKGDHLDTGLENLIIGPDSTQVDGRLKNESFGLGFRQYYSDESTLVTSIDYGSASDKPFGEPRNSTVSANVAYAFSPGSESQWILFINYSNNRPFLNNIPIPAFAYVYRPSKSFSVTLGIPFVFMSYADPPKTMFRLFLSPSSAGYDYGIGIKGPLQIFNNFTYQVRSYMHENRINDDDRLIFEEKTVSLGIRSPVARGLSLSFSGGLAFDRFYYEGEGMFEESGVQQRLKNDIFIKGKMTYQF
ncbi:MAG: hypothetical protein CL676_06190 [Bdellovibrionaceae bacterium]|nr:hypothetical protein [Pseudobdellovibrionaceae bacterium]|tara:strand:+ start:578 stop:1546 length:969 start_codon:yes stop_codon:yes gene_type:complete